MNESFFCLGSRNLLLRSRIFAAAILAMGAWSLASQNILACGISWALPTNHFDGIDASGHISYWERIGEMDCGNGLRLPLQINFNSGRDTAAASPYLGQGWLMPLLESKFVQEDENRFYMMQPDGLNNLFLRSETDSRVLDGSAGWKGEINNNTITAWASCGWKIVFTNGHIASMTTPNGRRLDWIYENGRVTQLREGSTIRLTVGRNTDGNMLVLNVPGGKKLEIQLDKKPRIQKIKEQYVITGVDNSLSALALANGEKRTFTFATDSTSLPTLRIKSEGSRQGESIDGKQSEFLSWDPETKLAIQHGEYIYKIIPNSDAELGSSSIMRTDSKGKTESWFQDTANGEETTQSKDGTKTVTSWFVGGRLEGAIRKRVQISDGKTKTIYQASYNENGDLLREILADGSFNQYKYDVNGQRVTEDHYKNGKQSYHAEYKAGLVSSVQSVDGNTIQYSYDKNGREVERLLNGALQSKKLYAPDDSWQQEEVYDSGSTQPSRVFRREYDASKRLMFEKITRLTGSKREVTKQYIYDDLGRLEKSIDSQPSVSLDNTNSRSVGVNQVNE